MRIINNKYNFLIRLLTIVCTYFLIKANMIDQVIKSVIKFKFFLLKRIYNLFKLMKFMIEKMKIQIIFIKNLIF